MHDESWYIFWFLFIPVSLIAGSVWVASMIIQWEPLMIIGTICTGLVLISFMIFVSCINNENKVGR